MTELMSNTATANLLVPMFLALAVAPGSDPVLPAIAATLGSRQLRIAVRLSQ